MTDMMKNHCHEEGRKLDKIGLVIRYQTFHQQYAITCFTTTKQIGPQQIYHDDNFTNDRVKMYLSAVYLKQKEILSIP